MNRARRSVLSGAVAAATLAVAVAAGMLRPRQALAAAPVLPLSDSLRALGNSNPTETAAIQIKAPDIAVDGSNVFIEFFSTLPNVDTLVVFVERNPQPFIAAFRLGPEVLPMLQTRIKVAETSRVWVVARSEGRFYKASKLVKVTVGGCGAGLN